MSPVKPRRGHDLFSPRLAARFDALVEKYPVRRSALVPMLLYAQDEVGYLSDAVIAEVAERIGITELEVRNVATYYSMLRFKPAGKFNMQVCTNISCMLRGAYDLYERFQEELGIGHKGVTPDGLFSLEEVECIGACCWAPAIQVNYDFHDELKPDQVPEFWTTIAVRPRRKGRRPMPRLVSHPDEVKIVSQPLRHGRGKHRPLHRTRRLRVREEVPRAGSGLDHQRDEGQQPARPRRCGFSHRHEVVIRAQAIGQAQVRPGQRRRERARNLQGPPDLPARSSRGD